MKKIILISLLFFTIIPLIATQKWEIIDVPFVVDQPLFPKDTINGSYQMEELDNTFFAIINPYGLIKSDDKCLTWDSCFFARKEGFDNPKIYFVEKTSTSLFVPSDNGIIYNSFDKGKTWSTTYLGDENKHPIKHLKFINDSVGYVGHIQNTGFLKTTDGGKTWNPLPDASSTFSKVLGILNFIPIDENTIYFIGQNKGEDYFFKTSDGGNNWTRLDTKQFEVYPQTPGKYINLIYKNSYFFMEKLYKPFALGNVNIMRSPDFINWEPIFISDTISGGKFINDLRIYDNKIIGLGGNVFVVSLDNGETWVDLYDKDDEFYGKNNPIRGFLFDGDYVYAQGYIVQKDGGGINLGVNKMFRYKLDLKTSVEDVLENINVYPNPTISELNIEFNSYIKSIHILDLTGKDLYSNTYTNNSKNISLDINFLQTGTYFIIINGKVYKRFVKN